MWQIIRDLRAGGVTIFLPYTPVIDIVRGLLLGTPVGNSAALAVAWCVGLTRLGYLWARGL
jgi:ABC-2 type transport system permease protein